MSVRKEILQELEQRLTEAGLPCLRHFPPERVRRWERPVAVLGLRSLQLETGGFGDYLGMVVDEETLEPCEVYGKRGTAAVAMDVYCSGDGRDAAALAEEGLDAALNALLCTGDGLDFRSCRQEQVRYDTASGLYRIRAELEFAVLLTARSTGDAAEIRDFRLGEIKVNV